MAQLFDPKGVGDYTRRALQRMKEYVDTREAATLSVLPNTNMFINGDFRFNQRNVVSAATSLSYPADRWWMNAGGGTLTCSRQLFTAGTVVGGLMPRDYVRCVTTGYSGTPGAGDNALLRQNVEDVNMTAGRQCTVSFYARAASGTPRVSVEVTSNFGTGGSIDENKFVGTVNLTTSWQRYSLTFSPPSTSGKVLGSSVTSSLRFNFWMVAGTNFAARLGSAFTENNTFEFWGMQFELGAVATPFVMRPWEQELALCQRYFQRFGGRSLYEGIGSGWTFDGTQAVLQIRTVVPMRQRPTISFGSAPTQLIYPNTGAFGTTILTAAIATLQSSEQLIHLDLTTAGHTANRPCFARGDNSLNAYWDFSAEYV